jgi:hypothetical protein
MPLLASFADALHTDMVIHAVEAIQKLQRDYTLPISEAEAIRYVVAYMRRGVDEQQNTTLNAERGDYLAHLAILAFHREQMLHDAKSTVPIVAYVFDERRHPKRPKGGIHWYESVRYNFALAYIAVWLCERYGISPARSESRNRKTCAAAVLAEASTKCGRPIAEKSIANILSRSSEFGSLLDCARVKFAAHRLSR